MPCHECDGFWVCEEENGGEDPCAGAYEWTFVGDWEGCGKFKIFESGGSVMIEKVPSAAPSLAVLAQEFLDYARAKYHVDIEVRRTTSSG